MRWGASWRRVLLAVIGAFMGTGRCTVMFTQWPGAILAPAALVIVVATVIVCDTWRQWELTAMQLGIAAVLAGAMAGSQITHDLVKRLTGIDTIRSGFILLQQNVPEDRVVDRHGEAAGTLPFAVIGSEFWQQYDTTHGKMLVR